MPSFTGTLKHVFRRPVPSHETYASDCEPCSQSSIPTYNDECKSTKMTEGEKQLGLCHCLCRGSEEVK